MKSAHFYDKLRSFFKSFFRHKLKVTAYEYNKNIKLAKLIIVVRKQDEKKKSTKQGLPGEIFNKWKTFTENEKIKLSSMSSFQNIPRYNHKVPLSSEKIKMKQPQPIYEFSQIIEKTIAETIDEVHKHLESKIYNLSKSEIKFKIKSSICNFNSCNNTNEINITDKTDKKAATLPLPFTPIENSFNTSGICPINSK